MARTSSTFFPEGAGVGIIPSRRDERFAPEEGMVRDATRIGQIATAGDGSPGQRAVLEEALS